MELHCQPHAVMFPYPAQGHINPMMQLAKKLISYGFFITFVNTDFNHERMFRNGAYPDSFLELPNLRFEHLPDGLPPGHGRFNQSVPEITAAILSLTEPFTKSVEKIMSRSGPPVTCIIADSFCSWMQDVGDKLGIPRVSLWTTPVHANLSYHFQSILISEGYIPLKDKANASKIVSCIPGVAPMPLSDYISFFLVDQESDYLFQWHLNLCMRRANEAIWNLGNNVTELESEAVEAFRKEVGNFLPIGPLLPEAILKGERAAGGAGPSIWAEEGGCEEWLGEQEERSVVYISFGSVASMEAEEVEELVRGVEGSGAPFLWAVRPDQGGEALQRLRRKLAAEEEGGGRRRGLMVAWAPQLAVLSHRAVGAFMTHCGWNSVLEGACAGVPILAKPGGFAEQRMNAFYVAERWQIGVRLPDRASAASVAAQIRGVLAAAGVRDRVARFRSLAHAALREAANLRLFVHDIRSRASRAAAASVGAGG